jgi:hypothetical protein
MSDAEHIPDATKMVPEDNIALEDWLRRASEIKEWDFPCVIQYATELALSEREAATAKERKRCAKVAYITCASTNHVTLGRTVVANIVSGKDAAAIRKGDE